MRGRPHGRSLRVELSTWLAVQSLLSLALVCWLVFVAIADHLEARQRERIREMELLVMHMVASAHPAVGFDELSHLLGDLSAAHEEFRIDLVDAEGRTLPVHRSGHYVIPPLPADASMIVRTFTLMRPEQAQAPLQVRLSLDVRRDDQLLERLALTLAAGVVLGTLLNTCAAAWRVHRDLAPVNRLVEQIDTLDAERLQERLVDTGQPTELLPLVTRFNELLGRLEAAYRRMASFDAAVAHELNTPIATLVTSNELALHVDTNRHAMRDLLCSNLEELERLGGIVRDMLFLSMSERGARARTDSVPSLAAVVREVVDFHEAALEAANIAVAVRGDASAEVDTGLLKRALSNLIDNATRHAEADSVLRVVTAPVDVGPVPGVRITVSNVGTTIPPAPLSRLFDRFYRLSDEYADPDETIPRRHGLGLSIVAAIARIHGGHTVARSADGVTTMGLVLPAMARVSIVEEVDRAASWASGGNRTVASVGGEVRYREHGAT